MWRHRWSPSELYDVTEEQRVQLRRDMTGCINGGGATERFLFYCLHKSKLDSTRGWRRAHAGRRSEIYSSWKMKQLSSQKRGFMGLVTWPPTHHLSPLLTSRAPPWTSVKACHSAYYWLCIPLWRELQRSDDERKRGGERAQRNPLKTCLFFKETLKVTFFTHQPLRTVGLLHVPHFIHQQHLCNITHEENTPLGHFLSHHS